MSACLSSPLNIALIWYVGNWVASQHARVLQKLKHLIQEPACMGGGGKGSSCHAERPERPDVLRIALQANQKRGCP